MIREFPSLNLNNSTKVHTLFGIICIFERLYLFIPFLCSGIRKGGMPKIEHTPFFYASSMRGKYKGKIGAKLGQNWGKYSVKYSVKLVSNWCQTGVKLVSK